MKPPIVRWLLFLLTLSLFYTADAQNIQPNNIRYLPVLARGAKNDSSWVPVLDRYGNKVYRMRATDIDPFNQWVGLVSQAATAAPTATVLKNTLGATISWTRSTVGSYTGNTHAVTFTTNKTFALITPTIATDSLPHISFARLSDSTFIIHTGGPTGTSADSQLVKTPFEIRVYK